MRAPRILAAAVWLALAGAASAAAPAKPDELPLSGPAYLLAEEAYAAHARRDYRRAIERTREALRLRPDSTQLRKLLRKTQAAQKRAREARLARAPAATPVRPEAPLPVVVSDPVVQAPVVAATAVAVPGPPVVVGDAGHGAATLGFRAYEAGDFPQAAAAARQAVELSPGNPAYRQLLVSALVKAGDLAAAEAAAADARAAGAAPGAFEVELAYGAIRAGEDAKAAAAFDRAAAAATLPASALRDASFASVRAGHDEQALAYFKRGINEDMALKLDHQLRFETRRAASEVARTGGVIASLTYRGAVAGLGVAPGANPDILQAGVEAYWRPLGYRNSRYLELFARAFQTLYSKGDGATGSDTRQAALGARYKPFSATNVVASFSRVFAPADGRDDWLAQLGYSAGEGTDLRADAGSWWTTRVAAEAGRYLRAHQTYALANVEAGRSFRLDGDDGHWVGFPHVSVAADYDSLALRTASLGLGPGALARFWFREDSYFAPRSYVDVSLQYRWRLAGAQRAEGVFLTTTLSY